MESHTSWTVVTYMEADGHHDQYEEDETVGRSMHTLIRLTLSCILTYQLTKTGV